MHNTLCMLLHTSVNSGGDEGYDSISTGGGITKSGEDWTSGSSSCVSSWD